MDADDEENVLSLEFIHHPLVLTVTLARFLAAVLILVFPLLGLVISFIFDYFDSYILILGLKLSWRQYHLWDKNVDWLAYVAELWVSAIYGVFMPMFLLLFWRFIGQFMFVKNHHRWLFVFFPNLFEAVFLWLVLFHPVAGPVDLSVPQPYMWLIIFVIAKEFQEIAMHYIQPKLHLLRIIDYIRKPLN